MFQDNLGCETNDPTLGRIRLHVAELAQLFNSIDPSRLQERDLDSEAERFIMAWARDIPTCAKLSLEVEVDRRPAQPDSDQILAEAVHSHFNRKAATTQLELRTMLRRGRTSLVIGLIFLAACVFVAELAVGSIQPASVGEIIRQGLTVAGWVAMWRPMEIFLYNWWPLVADRRLYVRLANMPVTVLMPDRNILADGADFAEKQRDVVTTGSNS